MVSGDCAALCLRAIDASYGGVQVLHEVDVAVGPGEVCALLGTNGAGKSTILRVASGLLSPDHGQVLLFGEDITRVPAHRRVERGLAMVAGGRATFASLSVEDNLRAGAYSLRRERRRSSAALAACYDRFPVLGQHRAQAAGTLSGGQQQVLALAKALLLEPRVLLVDELTMGLAEASAKEVLATVAALAAAGVAVLYVEQSVSHALDVAATACFLERGRMRFVGSPVTLAGRADLLRPVLLAPERAGRQGSGAT